MCAFPLSKTKRLKLPNHTDNRMIHWLQDHQEINKGESMRKLLFLSLIFGLVANSLWAQQNQIKLPPNNKPPKLDKGAAPKEGSLPPALVKLNIVKVKAPDINCFFNTACTVTVEDTTSPITVAGAKGSGFLQTRTCQGQRNSPAAGLYAYEYRVSLEDISVTSGKLPTFTSFTINFGQIIDTFDFNKDGKTGDQIFVTTEGGVGSVIPGEAIYDGNTITFKFNNPRLAGAGPSSKGQTSFFFGLVSKNPPRNVGVRAVVNEGTGVNLSARAPNF
jgi:hypothetical protein